MASGNGISGPAVAVAAVGGVLAYAGFVDMNPIEALRAISSGKPPKVPDRKESADQTSVPGSASGSAVVRAAYRYRGDNYTQALHLRTGPGWSDCSSFVSKAFKDVGIDPPTPNNTMGYLTSSRWKTIPKSQAQAGDIAVNAQHMVLVTGPGTAIGQQNQSDDVKTGSLENLMANSGSWKVRRYVGGVGDGTVAA